MGESSSFATMSQPSTVPRRVITVHGIRTTGAWQKELNDVLEENDIRHSPFDYGYLKLAMFINPRRRDKEIDRFRNWVSQYVNDEHQIPSIIAHSFGTYIVANALLKYEELKLDSLILCGSIIDEDYPWGIIVERGQVRRVLNESGSKDIWAKLVPWVVKDAGSSGAKGFSKKVDGIVRDIHRSGFRHSDFFYSLHVQRVWIPFLDGREVGELAETGKSKRPVNIKFVITKIMLAALILSFAILAWRYHALETIRTEATEDKAFKSFTIGGKCPFGGTPMGNPLNQCEIMRVGNLPSNELPKFHRTEGQLFYDKRNGRCPYPTDTFAAIREDGSRCIIEAPNNILLYHTPNTVYYRPFPNSEAPMSENTERWDLYGEDYRDFAIKGQEGVAICRRECALDAQCQAFSFSAKANRCWLKDRVPKGRDDLDVISGTKLGVVKTLP